MKAFNPFQASGVLQSNPKQDRRERFRNIFFAVLAVHVVLFLTLLIQGCHSGHQTASGSPGATAAAVGHN